MTFTKIIETNVIISAKVQITLNNILTSETLAKKLNLTYGNNAINHIIIDIY